MGRKFSCAFLTAGLCLFALAGRAQSISTGITNLLNSTVVTATSTLPYTNNSAGVQLTQVYIPPATFNVQNSGIGGGAVSGGVCTNEILNEQVSFDGVNYFTIQSFNPAGTNAQVSQFIGRANSATIYMRSQLIVNTNTTVSIQAY